MNALTFSLRSLGLALLLSLHATAAPANVQGIITDSEGAIIAKARVYLRADSAGKRTPSTESDTVMDTDAEGRFALQLRAGFYDMCVMADGFSPVCQKLFVNMTGILKPRIRPKADPKIAKYLGDVF